MASATVTNTFGSQTGPIPLAQLDTNYLDITGYLNNPYNRSNFANDSGVTNTIAISLNPAPIGYTNGLEISWRQASTNATGGVSITINALGSKSLLSADGSVPNAGQFTAGGTYKAIYNGTAFYSLSGSASTASVSVASQAQMEGVTFSAVVVTPANLVYSPYAAKIWGVFNGTVTGTTTFTANNSGGVSTVARTGTGSYSIVFSRALGGATICLGGSANTTAVVVPATISTATANITVNACAAGTPVDASVVSFWAFGDLA